MRPFALTCEGLNRSARHRRAAATALLALREKLPDNLPDQAGGWDSGRVASAQSIHVLYGGPGL